MVYKEFESLYTELALERSQRQNYYETIKKFPELINEYHSLLEKYNREEKEKSEALKHAVENYTIQLTNLLGNSKSEIALFKKLEQKLEKVQQDFEKIKEEQQQLFSQKPRLLRLRKFLKNDHAHRYLEELDRKQKEEKKLSLEKIDYEIKLKQKMQMIENYQVEIRNVEKYQKELTTIFDKWQQNKINELNKLKKEIEQIRKWQKEADFEELDLSQPYEELQTSNPWFTKEFRIKQSKLFFKALEVRKQFLYENRESFSTAWKTFKSPDKNGSTENDLKKVQESWQWVNFAIPVISTTFASFRKMFTNIEEEGISNLFIDEAGQALPQASVGAIFRSKKILVVGDPSQIKPVLTVDPNVLNLIRKNYRVSEHFISSNASTQTIIDNIGKYGFKNSVQKWRGIPLWVHRRSKDPMFTIANELSYDGLMVHGNPPKEIQGKGRWIDITGTANDKFVQEQAIYVKKEIKKIMDKEDNKTMDKEEDDKPMDKEDNKTKNKKEIYVITPFKNVAYKLERELNSINFVKRENGKAVNVGTVHTFQGKEAEIVFLVLGADNRSRGAAEWVVSEPNLINVAATRAKSEFYIVGDKKLYSQLGSEVATKTIELLEQYNEKRKPLL
ncbi:DNA helicase [Enterococcus casseliflavus]|nr:DNA helicase [Enterococcus casseliflavus]MUN97129.1 DNA helicase [Enterococcus casseliflavus]